MTAPLPLHERQLTELIAAVDTRTGLVASLDAIRRRWAFGSRKTRASIDDIARRTGVPRSTIHVYVTGRTLPPPDLLDTMVAVLGASRDERGAWAAALERVENAERDHPNPERPNQLPRVVPLVGRDEELAQLDALAARAGSAGFLGALVGPGGAARRRSLSRGPRGAATCSPTGCCTPTCAATPASPRSTRCACWGAS